MELFDTLQPCALRCFFDFAQSGDKLGAIRHLQSLSLSEIKREVLDSGFSMISKRHGKSEMINHAVSQIGVKTAVKRIFD